MNTHWFFWFSIWDSIITRHMWFILIQRPPRMFPCLTCLTIDLCPAPCRYQQLLGEIHQSYLDQRQVLLAPSISSTITDLTSQNNKDHCALVRGLCSRRQNCCLLGMMSSKVKGHDEAQYFSSMQTVSTQTGSGLWRAVGDADEHACLHHLYFCPRSAAVVPLCSMCVRTNISSTASSSPNPHQSWSKYS